MRFSNERFQSKRSECGGYEQWLSLHSMGDRFVECLAERCESIFVVIVSDADDELIEMISSRCAGFQDNGYLGAGPVHEHMKGDRFYSLEVYTADVYL